MTYSVLKVNLDAVDSRSEFDRQEKEIMREKYFLNLEEQITDLQSMLLNEQSNVATLETNVADLNAVNNEMKQQIKELQTLHFPERFI